VVERLEEEGEGGIEEVVEGEKQEEEEVVKEERDWLVDAEDEEEMKALRTTGERCEVPNSFTLGANIFTI
jgi:hypothetical protein